MKITTYTGNKSFQVDLSLREAGDLFIALPDGHPVKEGLRVELAPSAQKLTNLEELVNTWPWNGSFFPKNECFEALKDKVPELKWDELRRAIEICAKEYNSKLE